ncbi:hypothetical protein CHELA41_23188 [Hyphomicrobiales bacterium]|nr:hypothetical protein CHELA41_23188 [Hyphomicrobiales bacterium]
MPAAQLVPIVGNTRCDTFDNMPLQPVPTNTKSRPCPPRYQTAPRSKPYNKWNSMRPWSG